MTKGIKDANQPFVFTSLVTSKRHTPDVFLPLDFDPGQDAWVDWGEAYAVIAGLRQKVQVFVMRLCFSCRTFVMLFPYGVFRLERSKRMHIEEDLSA